MKLKLLLILIASIISVSSLACTKKQALDTLTKMGTFKHQYMTAGNDIERVKDLAVKVSHGGTLIGQGKYQEACNHYHTIADEYGFDLSQSAALTIDQINKHEIQAQAGCDIKSVVQRSTSLARNSMQLKQKMSKEQYDKFNQDLNKLGGLMRTDLAKACELSKHLDKTYSL